MTKEPSSGYRTEAESCLTKQDQVAPGGAIPGSEALTTTHADAEQEAPPRDDDVAGATPTGLGPAGAVDVESLIRTILRQLLADAQQSQLPFNGKLAVDEKEAAALLGLNPWQLRDLRTSGKISHHRIVGGRVRYTPDDLQNYLDSGHHRATG